MPNATPQITPTQHTLDLSEGTILVCHDQGIALSEPGGVYEALDTALLLREAPSNGVFQPLNGYMAVLRAGRITSSGEYVEVERNDMAFGHAIYGRKLIEGTAYYPDGAIEAWRIQVDPLNMRWNWTRQPDRVHDAMVFRLLTPSPTGRYALWQTGSGIACDSNSPDGLQATQESELLCVGPTAKNSFRLEAPQAGDLSIARAGVAAEVFAGEAGWEASPMPVTECRWTFGAVGLLRLDASWGLTQAAQDYQGRQPFKPVQASMDFDVFYARMSLVSLPLFLCNSPSAHYAPRASLFGPMALAPMQDIVLACEFLPLADPRAAAMLMRDTLDRYLSGAAPEETSASPRHAALLLVLAGRLAAISDDLDFLGARIANLRDLADGLLALRPEGQAIPLVSSDDGPVNEPFFAALCYAGLKRLAELEHSLAAPDRAKRWLTAAETLRQAALLPIGEGGLMHPGRGVFVYSAQPHVKVTPAVPVFARMQFQLRQFVVPCLLGLMEDDAAIKRAYDWIDDQYTYATGRGGCSCPPGADRGLYALLDVYVRQCHGISGADRVLQLVLDHALDFGLPMRGKPYQACLSDEANFADAAPYLGIVLRLHYGLDYTRDGWVLHTPRPLANYPFSRVTGLHHKHATYSITWQGRGRIKRVVVDGRTHRVHHLGDADGEHEVIVYLG